MSVENKYNVVVSGLAPCTSVTSNDAVLNVNQSVAITVQPSPSQTLCSGGTASFTVTATGSGITYQWRRGTTILVNGGNFSGVNTSTLTISNVSTSDADNYNVVVSGLAPCTSITSNDAVLNVNQSVAITVQPSPLQTLCSGATSSFSVTATGSGITYQWRRGTTNLVNGGNISGVNTSILTISNVSTTDAGNYNVIVSGLAPCPSVTSNDAALIINQPVVITVQPSPSSQSIC